jgi:hypothetical protein
VPELQTILKFVQEMRVCSTEFLHQPLYNLQTVKTKITQSIAAMNGGRDRLRKNKDGP